MAYRKLTILLTLGELFQRKSVIEKGSQIYSQPYKNRCHLVEDLLDET